MNRPPVSLLAIVVLSLGPCLTARADELVLTARARKADVPVEEKLRWDPKQTAIVICDMWDEHWCKCATKRVEEMAPKMNRVVNAARARGVLVVHAPSSCMAFYKDTPQRKLAQSAPAAKTAPKDIDQACRKLGDEPPLPIDDSDNGCDDDPPSKVHYPWKRQIATIDIKDGDAVSDSGREIFNLMEERGIKNVVLMGVHTNMCILARPFGLRQMVKSGRKVILARDLTDAMYNPKRKPFVSHQRGTELVVEHIEKHVCPSITSADLENKRQGAAPLPGTKPLDMTGDIASDLVDGVDRFLLKEIEKSVERRARHWRRDFSSAEAYNKSIEPNRKRLAHILGVRDARVPGPELSLVTTVGQAGPLGGGTELTVHAVRWPAFGDVHGDGLLVLPGTRRPVATVIALPDADQTPEQLVGLSPGTPEEAQFARRLAESGCRVVVPRLVNRQLVQRRNARLTNREYLYRSAFELGRHLIGYEVQKVLALVDGFSQGPVGVIGWGEGGGLALYAGALDPRINAVCVSGYVNNRNGVWQEPIDRNVFGLLDEFGDAELASMVAPRQLVVVAATGPAVTIPPGLGGAPARLQTPKAEAVSAEVERARQLTGGLKSSKPWLHLVKESSTPADDDTLRAFCQGLGFDFKPGKNTWHPSRREGWDPVKRHEEQLREIDRHSQHLLAESASVRQQFLARLDTKSVDGFKKTVEDYRRIFRDEVIGHFDYPLLPANPRSRKVYESAKWIAHEVVLDVFPDVIAFGVLLLPRDLKEGEKRPVVVCQHGLEGRPRDCILDDHPAYHDFAAKLCDRGFITFAPQNLYIFRDRFRTLQRKGNPIKKTLFSVIVPQHQQIVNWLKTLPGVDPERIAFYGLSYGGKSAMRIPPLVTDYCLSICSADFNEWVKKNASTRAPYSYVWSGEYEIFEFDLGSTFNYAEMAALICPRPFMVERGHFDGVGVDEEVGFEFAKVRNLYQAKLGIGDRCEIEWFVGPHTINGKGTYDFLHRHLNWPKR